MMIKLKTLLNPDIIRQIVDFQLMDNTINKKIRNRGNFNRERRENKNDYKVDYDG